MVADTLCLTVVAIQEIKTANMESDKQMIYWIDKKGGRHYHKQDCPMVIGPPKYPYEPVRHKKPSNPMATIKVDNRYYAPCPGCMRSMNRK